MASNWKKKKPPSVVCPPPRMLPRKRADLAGARQQLMSLTGITFFLQKKSSTLILCLNLQDVCACRENISWRVLFLFLFLSLSLLHFFFPRVEKCVCLCDAGDRFLDDYLRLLLKIRLSAQNFLIIIRISNNDSGSLISGGMSPGFITTEKQLGIVVLRNISNFCNIKNIVE